MRDSELCRIVPEWERWNKKKRDAAYYNEYLKEIMLVDGKMTQDEVKELEEKADAMDRERFLKLLPRRLNDRDALGLTDLNTYWMELEESRDEDRMVSVCRGLWDTSSASLINALDCRDDMVTVYALDYIFRQVKHNARALRRLRKSPKLLPWIVYLLDDTRPGLGGAVPMQEVIFDTILFVITGCSHSFFEQLLDKNIPSILFQKIRTSDVICLRSLGNVMESTIKVAKDYCDDASGDDDRRRSIQIMCQVASRMLCDRALQLDFSQQRFRSSTPHEYWVDVGDVAGSLATVLIQLQLQFSIPTPMEVRQHLGSFGDAYRPTEPTDQVERRRWSERYFCKRLKEVDFSTADGKEDGSELITVHETKAKVFADQRYSSIQCGQCKKSEDDDDELFRKCSRCKLVYYCSRNCQVAHWKTHKTTCTKPVKASLPEPLLNLTESLDRAYKFVEKDRHDYPTLFAVWLYERYGKQ